MEMTNREEEIMGVKQQMAIEGEERINTAHTVLLNT
jgi:hypothetical protein